MVISKISKYKISQLRNMLKQTNNFRRCSYCRHQNPQKQCCCRTHNTSLRTKQTSRCKNKAYSKSHNSTHHTAHPLADKSAISYINTTLPITSSVAVPHFSTSIIAENSVLRTENDYLKRELQGHHVSMVSAFNNIKDDRNVSTLPNSQTETSRTYQLHDKLYLSNRNLQQALIQLDNLSRANKQLNEKNTKVESEKEQLRIINEELYEECQRLKKKVKKLTKTVDSLPNSTDLKKIMQLNMELERENSCFRAEIQDLKQEIQKMDRRAIVEVENLSPQWVAHTSNKINLIQKNISKLQQQNKENSFSQNCSFVSLGAQDDPKTIKPQLIASIKLLKAQCLSPFPSQTSAPITNQLLTTQNCSLMFLIRCLCQALMQPLNLMCLQIRRDLEKTIKSYESRFDNVVRKLENFVMKVENQRLRETVKGKYFF